MTFKHKLLTMTGSLVASLMQSCLPVHSVHYTPTNGGGTQILQPVTPPPSPADNLPKLSRTLANPRRDSWQAPTKLQDPKKGTVYFVVKYHYEDNKENITTHLVAMDASKNNVLELGEIGAAIREEHNKETNEKTITTFMPNMVITQRKMPGLPVQSDTLHGGKEAWEKLAELKMNIFPVSLADALYGTPEALPAKQPQ